MKEDEKNGMKEGRKEYQGRKIIKEGRKEDEEWNEGRTEGR